MQNHQSNTVDEVLLDSRGSATGSLVVIDEVTADGSSLMNSIGCHGSHAAKPCKTHRAEWVIAHTLLDLTHLYTDT